MHVYLDHYHLKAKPFDLSPKPDFLWLGEKHQEALATMRYGIVEDLGFLLLTGDVGVGKTALIHRLIQSLDSSTIVAHITDPGLEALDFFRIMASQFNIPAAFQSKGEFLVSLEKFLYDAHKSHKKILLIVDEAQRLSHKMIDQIRVLSNIELSDKKLVNIFLVGQPEFKHMLMADINRPLRQRIAVNYHIDPLNELETAAYIEHRMEVAGAKQEIFQADAIHKIFQYTGGFPRAINIICDHALLTGFTSGLKSIDADVIRECENELRIEKGVELKRPAPPKPVAPAPGPNTAPKDQTPVLAKSVAQKKTRPDTTPTKFQTPVRAVRVAPEAHSPPKSRLFPILVAASIALCVFLGYHLLWSQPRENTNSTPTTEQVGESDVLSNSDENQVSAVRKENDTATSGTAIMDDSQIDDSIVAEKLKNSLADQEEQKIGATMPSAAADAEQSQALIDDSDSTVRKTDDDIAAVDGHEQVGIGIDRQGGVPTAQAASAPEMSSDGQEAGTGVSTPAKSLAAMATLSAAFETDQGSENDVADSVLAGKSSWDGKLDDADGDLQPTGSAAPRAPSPSNPPQAIPGDKPAVDQSKADSDVAKSTQSDKDTVAVADSGKTSQTEPKPADSKGKPAEQKTSAQKDNADVSVKPPATTNAMAAAASHASSQKSASGSKAKSGDSAAKPANTTKNLALVAAVSNAKPTPPTTQGAGQGVPAAAPATQKSRSDGTSGNAAVTKTGDSVKNASGPPIKTVLAAKAPQPDNPIQKLNTVGLEARLRKFLETYCDTYADKNLDAFSGLFAPGAKENGKPFESLLPKYERNFKYIDTIQYRIRLKDFAVVGDDTVTVNGDFFLEWLPPDKKWRENSGKITMSLKQSGPTFQVHQLDYQGNRAKKK
jgi:type II secretory pathway predicted ATPase ExeA